MLRDGISGDWVGTFESHRGALWEVSIDPEGTRVATGGSDFTVRYWDATSGDILSTFTQEHVPKVVQMHGKNLFVAGNMDHVRLYDFGKENAAPVQSTVSGFGRLSSGVLSSAGNAAYTAGPGEAAMQIWDLRTMSFTTLDLPAPAEDLEVVSGMLTVALKNQVRIYDLAGPAPALRHEIAIPDGDVASASLNPHFGVPGLAQVLTGERDVPGLGCVCRLWDLNGTLLDTLRGHEKPVKCVRFAPTGTQAASGSEDSTLRIWPLKERAAQRATA
jgi:serine-threonine kinase receptor-associated protein